MSDLSLEELKGRIEAQVVQSVVGSGQARVYSMRLRVAMMNYRNADGKPFYSAEEACLKADELAGVKADVVEVAAQAALKEVAELSNPASKKVKSEAPTGRKSKQRLKSDDS